ncbi:HAMP domain-containing protein, partial [bacterium]|nr:HAMP domain-containing protein [bacterium]
VWAVINQLTKKSQGVMLPQLILGEKWLGKVTNAKVPIPAIDEMQSLLNSKATIYQPMPESAGLLRVATNVINSDGNRALGTYIPAQNPDGSENLIYTRVMSGEDYIGISYEVDAWYITAFHPVTNDKGEIFAVLSVGVKQESVATLRNAIQQTKVGSTGFISILGGKNDQKGKYIISHDNSLDGQSAWEDQDNDGNLIIQEIINAAVALPAGETTSFRYTSRNDQSQQLVEVAYYAPWDWVILINANESDYQGFFEALRKTQAQMMWMFILFGLGLAAICSVVVFFLASKIANPLVSLTQTAKQLAVGDIYHEITHAAKDETGDLADAFRNLVGYIQNMAGAAQSIAKGDLSIQLTRVDSRDVLGTAFEEMLVNLRETISILKQGVAILDDESAQLAEGSSQVNQATSQIAVTIQEIAKGASLQAASVTKTTAI